MFITLRSMISIRYTIQNMILIGLPIKQFNHGIFFLCVHPLYSIRFYGFARRHTHTQQCKNTKIKTKMRRKIIKIKCKPEQICCIRNNADLSCMNGNGCYIYPKNIKLSVDMYLRFANCEIYCKHTRFGFFGGCILATCTIKPFLFIQSVKKTGSRTDKREFDEKNFYLTRHF